MIYIVFCLSMIFLFKQCACFSKGCRKLLSICLVLGSVSFSVSWAEKPKMIDVQKTLMVPGDSLEKFTVDSIEIEIGDAFDDSKAYTYLDSTIYRILNWVHIDTREFVIRRFLLFNQGDSVNLYNLIESERLLREQRYLSDAQIERREENGKNILKVKTSDNWTLSVPLSLEHPGDEWYYGIGIQENNFLGFGQTLGVYYAHDEFRDMYSALYENAHFIWRYNHLRATYSYNTDGYAAFGQMNVPYLSRQKNQWAYTIEGFSFEGDKLLYWSGNTPPQAAALKKGVEKINDLQKLNGDEALEVLEIERFREDSLSVRLGRSFGNAAIKLYLTGSYDYHEYGKEYDGIKRFVFNDGGVAKVIPESELKKWLPEKSDSRFGFSAEISRIRYDRFRNFRNVKWTEDVDRGYSVKAKISKNSEALGADNNDWRVDYRLALAFGNQWQHLSLSTRSHFYFDDDKRRDIYEKLSLEYIFKPSLEHATVLTGQMDTYKRSAYGEQLTLGGLEGLSGLPTALFAGQTRFYANLEQRYFPNLEIGTVIPVFTAFVSVGETSESLRLFEPRDLQYLAGFGIRFAMTKSIMRTVSHIDISWPIHGPLKRSAVPKISIIGKYSL